MVSKVIYIIVFFVVSFNYCISLFLANILLAYQLLLAMLGANVLFAPRFALIAIWGAILGALQLSNSQVSES